MPQTNSFLDLTNESDDFEFPHPPSAVWLIFSLEFPAIYQGEKYILATQPYYGDASKTVNFGEGIWYPPFSAFPVDLRFFPTRNLGEMREKLEQTEREKFHEEFIDEIAYNLGLGEPRYERVRERPIDEYKLSPRGHNVYKFFRLVRYRCWHSGKDGLRNLADPETAKGLAYIPLNLPKVSIQSKKLGPHRFRFYSRVVATHFEHLVGTYRGERTIDKYTQFSDADIVNAEEGFLLFFDVSGFGKTEAATRTASFHPTETSSDIAQSFRTVLSQYFLAFFQELEISHYVTLGDGFIAGVPYRSIKSKPDFFRCLSSALGNLSKALREMNNRIENSGESVGLRASVLEGEYRYGRIAGLSSLRAEFDGTLLIDAARLDAGTKEHLSPIQRSRHLIVSSYSEKCLDIPILNGCDIKDFEVDVKEKKATSFMKIIDFDAIE
ncbi:MAG: hypothetical protein AAF429_12420 [Pseudomonadota bacterium]